MEDTRRDQAKTVTSGTRNPLRATNKERTTLTITAPAAATVTPTGPSVTTRMEERIGTKIGTKIGIEKDMLTITSEEETMMTIGGATTGLEVHPEAIKTTAAATEVHRLHLEEKVLWFLSVMSSERMTMTTVLGTATAMRITTETETETTMAMVQLEAMAITADVTAMTEIGTSSQTLPSSAISIIEAVAEAEVAVGAGLTVDEVEEDLHEAADTVAMITAKAATMVTTTETAAMEAAITTTTTTTTTAVVTFLASVGLGTLVVAAGAVAQPEEDTEPRLRMIDTERNENNGPFSTQVASLNSQVASH